MTDEEEERDSALADYLFGYEVGRQHERMLIVAWLQANLRGHVDPWSKAAASIEAGEHRK